MIPSKEELMERWARPEWLNTDEYRRAINSWHNDLTQQELRRRDD